MGRRLQIYTPIGDHAHASAFYRLQQPYQFMEARYPLDVMVDRMSAQLPAEHRTQYMISSSHLILYNALQDGVTEFIDKLEKQPREGGWFPPTPIVTFDDAMWHVRPTNMIYGALGIRHWDNKFVMPGDDVYTYSDVLEKEIVAWRNGDPRFNIVANHARLDALKKLTRKAHGVIVTTPTLADYIKDETGCTAEPVVFPNCVNLDRLAKFDVPQHKGCRILLQQSSSHGPIAARLLPHFKQILADYPHVTLVFAGGSPARFLMELPQDRIEYFPPVDFILWHPYLALFNCDINLTLVDDDIFDDCRSGLKFYEGAMPRRPMATLASDRPPYVDVIHGETGWKYKNLDEFDSYLRRMIENPKETEQIAANAKDWVNENRNPRTWAPVWWQWLQEARDSYLERFK